MKVITVRRGEVIVIGKDITVSVAEVIPHRRVRLGVAAPKAVDIVREEMLANWKGREHGPPPLDG